MILSWRMESISLSLYGETMIIARNIVAPRRSRFLICRLKISLKTVYSQTKAPRRSPLSRSSLRMDSRLKSRVFPAETICL